MATGAALLVAACPACCASTSSWNRNRSRTSFTFPDCSGLRVCSSRVSVRPCALPPHRHSPATITAKAKQAADGDRLRLNNLAPQPGSRKRNKRKGRGIAAGQGASCGFGMRGQKSRSGSGVRPGFEGGQMPLYRRLPKLKGIAGGMGAGLPKYVTVNLGDIASLDLSEGEEVSLELLKSRGLVNPTGRERNLPLKVLGDGDLDVKLSIKAAKFSESAVSKLEALGCTFQVLPGKKKFLPAQAVKRLAREDAFFARKRSEAAKA